VRGGRWGSKLEFLIFFHLSFMNLMKILPVLRKSFNFIGTWFCEIRFSLSLTRFFLSAVMRCLLI
jgi:hypothetical protein